MEPVWNQPKTLRCQNIVQTPSVETLFPSAKHRHCVRHLYNNFKVLHKGLELKQKLWAAARATTVPWFDVEMSSLQKLDDEAYKWLKKENAHYWSRSHFSEHPKCDILLNNLCEAFNSAILDARDKPILTMLETLRMYMMLRMAKQREACDKWHGDIGPRIHTIVEKNKVESSKCIAHLAGQKMYQVVHMSGVQFAVDLAKHTCTCRGWNLTGIPCGHAIACICRRHEDPVKYIHSCYKKASWKRAYGPFIHPIANEELWEHANFPPILPPVYHKQLGRPKKVRAREKDEKPAAPTGSKLSRSFHVKIKCSICGEHGHNKRKCDKRGGANNINKAKRPSASRGQPSTINKAKRPSASRGQPGTISERTIQPNLASTSTYQPSSSLPMESQPVSSVTTNTTRKFRLKSPAKKTKI
ncbi:hypothetical protein CerSpe_079460 [Prunus speciosa]